MKLQSFFRFPGFLSKACTLSYDDGVREDERLIEIMRKYGLKGTFNINSQNLAGANGRCLTADEIKEIFGDDTEIAIHGYRHLSLPDVTPAIAMRDVVADRENLESTFERVVCGMAYAYGTYSDEVVEMLRAAGVAYARTTLSTESFNLPEEWLTLHPTCHHNNPKLFDLVDEFLEEDSPKFWRKKPKLFYLWGHSYEFPRDDNWHVIERFGEIMSKRDDVWMATNMEIYKYIEAFNRLIFSADISYVENPSAIDVYFCNKGKNVILKAGTTTKL